LRDTVGTQGILCLTDRRLIFLGARGQARIALDEIAEMNVCRRGGESFLVSMMTGGLIEVRVGAESSYFEIQTQTATAEVWPRLQGQWASAKDRRRGRATAPRGAPSTSVADELRKLSELRAEGVLTEDEFAQEKRRLLQH
jgi:hypothetical protein